MKLSAGLTCRSSFKIDAAMIERFAELSGDRNPIHMDSEEAKAYGYPRQVAPGALLMAFLSKMIGMEIPGQGAVWMSHSIDWLKPVFIEDEIELIVKVKKFVSSLSILELDIMAINSKGECVMQGKAKVKAMKRLNGETKDVSGTGRVALVTGGSRGIGAAIAQRLAACGMIVAINYHKSSSKAKAIVEAIQSAGGSAKAIAADLGDPQATTRMVKEIIQSFGKIDVIVHSASPRISSKYVAELGYKELEPYLKVYLGGALVLVAEAFPSMAKYKFGRFIFLGTAAMFGMPPTGWAAYLAAKEALWGLVRSMALELGPMGITSNMISPGMTVTDLTADISIRAKEVEARRNPMRRLATAQDTAELVAFLANSASGYINGANLPVAGGPL